MRVRNVVLVKPPNDLGPEHHSLYGLLCIAGHLRANGVPFEIINANHDECWRAHLRDASDAGVLVGVSVLTAEIAGAVEASDAARSNGASVLWGGIHSQLFPEQVLADESVDYVCTGEGESAILKLATGEEPSSIPNIGQKEPERKLAFAQRAFEDLDALAFPAYDLVDDSSPWLNRHRFQYDTSRGCPHRCAFCNNPVLVNNVWRTRSAERVVHDLSEMRGMGCSFVEFVDDNPFVRADHFQAIAESILAKRLDIRWSVNCRAEYVSRGRIDVDYLRLLFKAGMRSISVGGESGSQRILDMMTKDIRVTDIVEAARAIASVPGLDSSFSFFFGAKGEEVTDIAASLRLFDELKRIFPAIRIGVNIFTPYPRTPLSEGLVREPTDLRMWLEPSVRSVYSDRFEGKPWQNDPDFYRKLAKYSGLIYSPPYPIQHGFTPGQLIRLISEWKARLWLGRLK